MSFNAHIQKCPQRPTIERLWSDLIRGYSMKRYVYFYFIGSMLVTTAGAFGQYLPTPKPSPSATKQTSGANSISVTNASGGAISNYPYQFGRPFVDGAIANQPRVLINGQLVVSQADVKNRYPDGSVEFAVIAVVIPAIPASGSLTLTFQNQSAGNNTPLTAAQMLASTYNFDASMALTPVGGTAQAASARTMLQNGDYKLWTSGPVAQTIMLGDDSAARKYDIGLGDGYHPFRPRFYATFWPATHQVFIRCVGENGVTVYSADLSGTQTTNPKLHWALSRWTREFWIGGAPSAQINIDNNLAYLESTRFLPNFDTSIAIPQTSIAIPQTSIAAEYA